MERLFQANLKKAKIDGNADVDVFVAERKRESEAMDQYFGADVARVLKENKVRAWVLHDGIVRFSDGRWDKKVVDALETATCDLKKIRLDETVSVTVDKMFPSRTENAHIHAESVKKYTRETHMCYFRPISSVNPDCMTLKELHVEFRRHTTFGRCEKPVPAFSRVEKLVLHSLDTEFFHPWQNFAQMKALVFVGNAPPAFQLSPIQMHVSIYFLYPPSFWLVCDYIQQRRYKCIYRHTNDTDTDNEILKLGNTLSKYCVVIECNLE